MFDVVLPESHVRQKSARAAVGAFLVHVCVISAAVSSTAPAPVPVMLERRDTFLLRITDVPASPRMDELPPGSSDLPEPPSTNFHTRPDLPTLSFHTGELADPGSARAMIGPASRVRLDSLPTISNLMEMSGPTQSPELIGELQPDYPMELRRAGVQGMVRVEYVVRLDGRMDPRSLRVLSSTHPGFVLTTLQALRKARFKPAQRNRQPVAVTVQQIIRFTLQ
jgi:periplasmic protein TonB